VDNMNNLSLSSYSYC